MPFEGQGGASQALGAIMLCAVALTACGEDRAPVKPEPSDYLTFSQSAGGLGGRRISVTVRGDGIVEWSESILEIGQSTPTVNEGRDQISAEIVAAFFQEVMDAGLMSLESRNQSMDRAWRSLDVRIGDRRVSVVIEPPFGESPDERDDVLAAVETRLRALPAGGPWR